MSVEIKKGQNPTEELVAEIVRKVFSESVSVVNRFTTGSCNFVYDVVTESKRKFVVRIARRENKHLVEASIYWHKLLKPKGVPFPGILYSDTESVSFYFPYLIIERLEGKDLGIVYPQLSAKEKRNLAKDISNIQKIAGSLPLAKGFGFAGSYESNFFHQTWTDVLHSSLDRSRKRIKEIGAINVRQVERVAERLDRHESYFSQIKPKCFLDDTTTKNVIIHHGKLSGIVDFDWVCFGDNLLTMALTQMSLLNSGYDLDYIDFWCAEAKITDEQKDVLKIYTAIFCVDFMSELGQTFNKEKSPPVKPQDVERLSDILEVLLK